MRDPRVEDWLKKKGIPFQFVPDFPLEKIDRTRSRKNLARLGEPIKTELAESYGIQMGDGVDFTAILVYERVPGSYVIISGNHRDEGAAQAGVKELDAYVAQTTDLAMIDILTRTANGIEGERTTRRDALQHAMHFKDTHGMLLKDAAVECGVPIRALQTMVALRKAKTRMEKLGIEPAAFHESTQLRMGNIRSDVALKASADMVKTAKLGGPLLEELVTSLNTERTDDAQVEIVNQWMGRPDIQARMRNPNRPNRRAQPTRDDQLLSLFQRLFGHMARTAPGMRVGDPRRDVLRDSWKKLSILIEEYLGVSERAEASNGAERHPASTPL